MSSGSARHRGVSGTLRIFQLFGINVYLHWSWAVVAIFLIQARDRPYTSQAWNIAEYVSLFGIVLLHEFGHSLACRSVGGKADRIMLWPLGGVAYVRPPRRPGAMLWSIAAGPLVNVALIPITIGLLITLGNWEPHWPRSLDNVIPVVLAGASNNFEFYLRVVALTNGFLLVFNMLPIYPLDGGQIVQSVLWFFIGPHRSLRVAAMVGLAGAGGVVVWAMYERSLWFIVLALFGASRSWQGLKQAKAMATVLAVPRHAGTRCPACYEAAPFGNYWRCRCGLPFDPFSTAGSCPQCGTLQETTGCPLCGDQSPHITWLTIAEGALPQAASKPA